MANLLDGIRRNDKSEIAKLFCNFRVYNITAILHMGWQCICYALCYVVHLVARLFKKEISMPPVYFWKKRYEMLYESCMQLEKEVVLVALFRRLKKKMRLIGVPVAKSDDKISAEITAIVARLYPRADLKGMSVAEKNDYICKKYPRQKKLDEKMCLRLWIIVSAFVLLASGIFYMSKPELRVSIGAVCILTEMLWGYFVYRKIFQWQLARLVWVAGKGLGQPFSVDSKVAVKFPSGQDKETCERDFLVYHTLRCMAKGAAEENKSLLEDMAAVRELLEKDRLKQRWEKYFKKLEFKSEVFSKAVNHFAFVDFERLEQRLAELSDAGDPIALGEKRKNSYMVPFSTVQGDIGAIYFTASQNKSKRLCISRLERKGIQKRVPMTAGKLRVLLEKEEHRIGALYQDYLSTIIPKEKKLASAKQNVSKLEERLSDAERLKQVKEAELLKLKKQMGEKEKECEEIHGLLAMKGLSHTDYEQQKQAFLKTQRQLSSLKSDYKFCEKKWEEASDAYDTAYSRKEVHQKEITELCVSIKARQKKFYEELAEAVKDNKKNSQWNADALLGELLIKRLGI